MKRILDPIHHAVVLVATGNFDRAVRDWRRLYPSGEYPNDAKDCFAMTFQPQQGVVCIWFETPKPPIVWAAHECFHASVFILQGVGISFNRWTEEAYAYHLGFLVSKVSEALR